jgi:hypothetical protein
MCILTGFNLIEAYINGLAWGYAQAHDLSKLSKNQRSMIEEAEGSIVRRLITVPNIIANNPSPLNENTSPMREFIEIIKPYRDSIVHASPFAAPERFGGYAKLEKLYELNFETVQEAVRIIVEIIGVIHRHVTGEISLPPWFLSRNEDGTFHIAPED